MSKYSSEISFLVMVLFAFCYADRLTNGDFEDGTIGQSPPGWTYSGGEGGVAISISKVSPFTNTYFVESQKSIYLTDSIFLTSIPRISQSFIQSYHGELKLRFDFYIDGPGHFWRVCLGNGDMSSVAAEFYVGSSFHVNGNLQTSIIQRIWYQIQAILDITTGLQSGRLYRWDNGQTVLVSEWVQTQPPSNYNSAESVSTIWIADSQTNASSVAPPAYFDNVSVLLTFCGDVGTYYFVGDMAGKNGVGGAYRDCRVDIFDLLVFADYWLDSGL